MPLDQKQIDTIRMQLQAANLAGLRRGEDEAEVALEMAEQAEKADADAQPKAKKNAPPPAPRVATSWMVRRGCSLATDGGIIQFRAGQVIDDPSLVREMESGGVEVIPRYGDVEVIR